FLEQADNYGMLVMDESEKQQDRRFVNQMRRYYTSTKDGRLRSTRVIPSPLFVSSDMAYPVQAADVCLYCINAGFRKPGLEGWCREEIRQEFGPWLERLQFHGSAVQDGLAVDRLGIIHVENPYV